MKAVYAFQIVGLILLCVSIPITEAGFNVTHAMNHLQELQNIAYSVGNGNRAAGTTGYNASADYVMKYLQDNTNFQVVQQHFPFYTYQVAATPSFQQISPDSLNYVYEVDFRVVRYSTSGEATAEISSVGDGCSDQSYSTFSEGLIAICITGNCNATVKAQMAVKYGAAGLLIYNDIPGGSTSVGSLDNPEPIVVFGLTYDLGHELSTSAAPITVYIKSEIESNLEYTSNIIVDVPSGNEELTVILGAHLDSVLYGPGINDDGSGSASLLELAFAFNAFLSDHSIVNHVRFCWWGAEELGKLGSRYYVHELVANNEISNVVAYLNFDMVGSPNFMRAVYDGATAPEQLQAGSLQLQYTLSDYFSFSNLEFVLTPFGTGSDYYYFLQNGVPSGGLFTGTNTIKTMEYRSLFGGIANAGFDPCYHMNCDTVENIDVEVLDQNGKSADYAQRTLSQMSDIKSFLNGGVTSKIGTHPRYTLSSSDDCI